MALRGGCRSQGGVTDGAHSIRASGFFTDEAVLQLTVECPIAILLALGLWCESDDAGAFKWSPLTLKARYLGATSVDVNELLEGSRRSISFADSTSRGIGSAWCAISSASNGRRSPTIVCRSRRSSRAFAGFGAETRRGNGADDEDPSSFGGDHGAVEERYDTATIPIPDPSATATGIPPQKEEGGRRKEESPPAAPRARTRTRARGKNRSPTSTAPR